MNKNIVTNNKSDNPVPRSSPKVKFQLLQWLKHNLFSSWFNTILTIIFSAITIYIIIGASKFIFVDANWSAVSDNFRQLMVGRYPIEELWRVWTPLCYVSLLLGLSWAKWKDPMGSVAWTLLAVMAVCSLLPFVAMASRIWLIMNIVLVIAGYVIGHYVSFKRFKLTIIIGWFVLFPVLIFFLAGFNVLTPVSTRAWGGFLLTCLISFVSIVFSFPLGVLLALGRRSNLPVVRWFSIAYIELIRAVPLITILFIATYLLPFFLGGKIELDDVLKAMVGFTLFASAYLAENIRGGLQAIPRGQFEAAHALGLNATFRTLFVILPQALRTVIPAIVGLYIGIFKDTVLVQVVGLSDIVGIGKKITSNLEYFQLDMEIYLFSAFVFFIFCYLMSYVSRRLEVKLGVGKR
ncbi:amino acid ABC transporter permease [Longirhabdus pacifica]|uniref:amino acid ABC transporter permease n=1 Tax=Longirhabdus pacifica TaxID=2305227 RepID=UPI001F0C0949|nr:amino acid ABC transporter permease [Longirhabdus pacifica]